MKKSTLLVCFALVALPAVNAQMFHPDTRRGGHSEVRHSHSDRSRTTVHMGVGHRGYAGGPRFSYVNPWYVDRSWHPSVAYHSPYRYVPAYGYYDGYGHGYPDYGTSVGYYGTGNSAAANGLVLGALAGGIIGHNSGEFRHNGWRGAAWGAGLGWLLGAVADANRRTVTPTQAAVVAQPPVQYVQAPSTAPAQASAQPVTVINNYYNTPSPMSGANGMFGR